MEDWLQAAARAHPGHTAVVADDGTLTYSELEDMATTEARELAERGVAPGDAVMLPAVPGTGFAARLHALPKLGAVAVPFDPRDPSMQSACRALPDRFEPGVHSVLLTSGTTGERKPVELAFANHRASAAAFAEVLGTEPEDRWLCCLPLFHVAGLAILLRAVIGRTTVVIHPSFDAARVRHELESGQITLVSLVPTMLHRLRRAGLARAPGLRAMLLGGAPIPGDLLDWADEAGLPVRPTYGMTETASGIATAPVGERAALPHPGVELSIAADGEVLVRGPMVARGALAPDGWLHTGDRGRLDSAGRLHVEGRIKEVIVTGGEKVAAAEVEAVLLAHPAVADAAVVGVPDAEWGEAVTAFVVARGSDEEPDLWPWCRERLAPFKVPKRIELVPELTRNAAGKVVRDLLR